MKKSVLIRLNALIAAVLAFLGMSGCKQFGGGIGEVECKYGIPTSEVFAQGQVVDESDQPIPGIQVTLRSEEGGNNNVLTNENGEFELVMAQAFCPDSVLLIAEDVDGEENGAYQSDTLVLKPEYTSGDGVWNLGTGSVTDIKITLSKK